jgi:PAS domain-containing protein
LLCGRRDRGAHTVNGLVGNEYYGAQTRAEEKLAESERRFRQLAESITHHVWSFHRNDSVGYWNQRLIGYTGLTKEELCSGGWPSIALLK